jgi:hypothetical protein
MMLLQCHEICRGIATYTFNVDLSLPNQQQNLFEKALGSSSECAYGLSESL